MVSFALGKEIAKDVFVLSRAWDKEKILSPHKESNLRPPMLYRWATETLQWARSYNTRPAYC